jgi:SPP1 family predicted phage head-tail adaptor
MNLNGKVINPGELRTSVALKSRTVSVETGGARRPTYTTIKTVWAKWTNAHGNELVSADGINAEAPATVLIRYTSGIDTTCAIDKGGLLYEILSIDDIQERHEYMELKVKRIKEG